MPNGPQTLGWRAGSAESRATPGTPADSRGRQLLQDTADRVSSTIQSSSPEASLEQLPFRLEGQLTRTLGISQGVVDVCFRAEDRRPALRCVLPRPVSETVSMVVRVHSAAGIPLASAPIQLNAGDQEFETGQLDMLAMEGYAHLTPDERQIVERRVWSRRAFATGSTV